MQHLTLPPSLTGVLAVLSENPTSCLQQQRRPNWWEKHLSSFLVWPFINCLKKLTKKWHMSNSLTPKVTQLQKDKNDKLSSNTHSESHFTDICVCVSQWKKKVPDELQVQQAIPAILQVISSKHNANKNTTRGRGPFHQSITVILTGEKREAVTNPTHVAVYLIRDLDWDRSWLQGWQWVPGPVQRVKESRKIEMTLTVEYSEMPAKKLNISK